MRYVTTQTGIYSDSDFANWTRDAIWLYRYLYENDHVHGLTGTGNIRREVIRAEARMSDAEISAAIKVMGDKVRWYADGSYWVVGRAKHAVRSPKHIPAVIARIAECGKLLRDDFWKRYTVITEGGKQKLSTNDTLSVGYTTLPTESVNESDAESETDAEVESEAPPAPVSEKAPERTERLEREESGLPPVESTNDDLAGRLGNVWAAHGKLRLKGKAIECARENLESGVDYSTIEQVYMQAKPNDTPWELLKPLRQKPKAPKRPDPACRVCRRSNVTLKHTDAGPICLPCADKAWKREAATANAP